MTTIIRTTDADFWKALEKDHEPVVQTEPTSSGGGGGAHTAHAMCRRCDMPAHLEMLWTNSPGAGPYAVMHGREAGHIWVPRHGPAPFSRAMYRAELRGKTPVIPWPDAVWLFSYDNSAKRHLLKPGSELVQRERGTEPPYINRAARGDSLCGRFAGLHYAPLAHRWQHSVCELCISEVQ